MITALSLLLFAPLTLDNAPYWLFEGHGLPLELVPYRMVWSQPGASIIDVSTPERRAAVESAMGRARMRMAASGVDPEWNCMGFRFEPVPLERPEIPENIVRERRALPQSALTRAQIQDLVDEVSPTRYFTTLSALSAFGSRYSFSTSIAAARDYIEDEFQAAGLEVRRQSWVYNGSSHENLIATLRGDLFPDQYIIVGGHYDSLPSTGAAPGTEDNGSGTAGVLELARIMADERPARSIVFIAWGVEEQGLRGSYHYVSQMTPQERQNLVAAVMMDMISYSSDTNWDVQLDTRADVGTALVDLQVAAAQEFTSLTVNRRTTFLGRSDHQPFIESGLPASLSIENEWQSYPHYHQSTDTIDRINPLQGAEIVKMNVATVAILANPLASSTTGSTWNLY
jgi:hypothetical protein